VITAVLTADPPTVEKGQAVTLHWSAQNATDFDVSPGPGKVQSDGSATVSPQESTLYTLTASTNSQTTHATAFVSVTSPDPPPINPVNNPTAMQVTRPGFDPDEITREATHERPPVRTTRHEIPVVRPQINPSLVTASITLGDFHVKRGEYDDAISSYQRGLQLDPSNATLRQKLEEAIRACHKENSILGENLNCGSR
jgi:hypothetical protein